MHYLYIIEALTHHGSESDVLVKERVVKVTQQKRVGTGGGMFNISIKVWVS